MPNQKTFSKEEKLKRISKIINNLPEGVTPETALRIIDYVSSLSIPEREVFRSAFYHFAVSSGGKQYKAIRQNTEPKPRYKPKTPTPVTEREKILLEIKSHPLYSPVPPPDPPTINIKTLRHVGKQRHSGSE